MPEYEGSIEVSIGGSTEKVRCGVVGSGKGGTIIVETPIALAEGAVRNGPIKFKLTEKMLDEMVENYSQWVDQGGPAKAGFIGHAENLEELKRRRQGKEKAALHLLRVWREDKVLWGRIEFQPWAWEQHVWANGTRPNRGLSIVFNETGKTRSGEPQGATLHGVDVVPEPFFPVEIAASVLPDSFTCASMWVIDGETLTWNCSVDPTNDDGDSKMPDDKVTMELIDKLRKEVAEKDEAVKAALEAAEEAKAAAEAATAKVTEIEASNKKLKDEIAAGEVAAKGREATEAITLALEKGVLTKAEVQGFEESPKAALEAFNKLEIFKNPSALRTYCGRIEVGKKVSMGKRTSSGTSAADSGNVEKDPQLVFLAKVDEVIATDKELSYREALTLAASKFPTEYSAYEAEINATTEDEV